MPKRYFDEISSESKFKPGVLSPDLRSALGLHDDKLPIWIYRMRVLGYPPGWLKEADMSQTVVPMIMDSSSSSSSQPAASQETWNVDSLISFPGFNTAVPEGVKDDYQLLGMPPMMPHQQLKFATANLKKPAPVPYKRIRISSPKDASADTAADETSPPSANDSEETDKQPEESESKDSNETPQPETPRSRLISVGVPVPTPTRKPPLEKWSENNSLSELIYFENLPNYTGVFDKMRNVIGKVRNRLSGLTDSSKKSGADSSDQTAPTSPDSAGPSA